MSWEWSHSEEAYDNARTNIRNLPSKDLRDIYTEIVAHRLSLQIENLIREEAGEDPENHPVFPDDYFDTKISERIFESEKLSDLIEGHEKSAEEFTDLSEFIFNFASEHRECSNGGHDAYVCPFNCHSVSFSTPEELEDAD